MMGLLFNSLSGQVPDFYDQKRKAEAKVGRKLSRQEFIDHYLVIGGGSSLASKDTSIFDPALCELMYAWFSASGDEVLDPFAGGSVRGIVAEEMGRSYTGVDLRQEQVDANIENAKIFKGEPVWICGNSAHIDEIAPGVYDFILTCPPYGDLEKYSDNPDDLSNMPPDDFDAAYYEIIQKTMAMLNDDRFAVLVVGNYRDGGGFLRDLVGLTVRACEDAGLRYYNDFIFVTPVGSLPIRVGKSFTTTRKMGRTHQYALCFVKGDPKKAAARLGEVEIPDLAEYMEE